MATVTGTFPAPDESDVAATDGEAVGMSEGCVNAVRRAVGIVGTGDAVELDLAVGVELENGFRAETFELHPTSASAKARSPGAARRRPA